MLKTLACLKSKIYCYNVRNVSLDIKHKYFKSRQHPQPLPCCLTLFLFFNSLLQEPFPPSGWQAWPLSSSWADKAAWIQASKAREQGSLGQFNARQYSARQDKGGQCKGCPHVPKHLFVFLNKVYRFIKSCSKFFQRTVKKCVNARRDKIRQHSR